MSTTINHVIADVQSAKLPVSKVVNSGVAISSATGAEQSCGISVICYDNDIPDFVATALEQVYQNFYSSLPHLKLSKNFVNASTYVERVNERIISLILFQK